MNKSVDPCDDFYEYACGNWKISNPIPPTEKDWDLWSIIQKKVKLQIRDILEKDIKSDDMFPVKWAKKWYKSCMNKDAINARGLSPIASILSRIGGWPMAMEPGEWDSVDNTWPKIDQYYTRLIGIPTFFDYIISYGTLIPNDSIIVFTEPNLPFSNDILILNRTLLYENNNYKTLIKETAREIAKESATILNEEELIKDTNDLINFEKQIFEILNDEESETNDIPDKLETNGNNNSENEEDDSENDSDSTSEYKNINYNFIKEKNDNMYNGKDSGKYNNNDNTNDVGDYDKKENNIKRIVEKQKRKQPKHISNSRKQSIRKELTKQSNKNKVKKIVNEIQKVFLNSSLKYKKNEKNKKIIKVGLANRKKYNYLASHKTKYIKIKTIAKLLSALKKIYKEENNIKNDSIRNKTRKIQKVKSIQKIKKRQGNNEDKIMSNNNKDNEEWLNDKISRKNTNKIQRTKLKKLNTRSEKKENQNINNWLKKVSRQFENIQKSEESDEDNSTEDDDYEVDIAKYNDTDNYDENDEGDYDENENDEYDYDEKENDEDDYDEKENDEDDYDENENDEDDYDDNDDYNQDENQDDSDANSSSKDSSAEDNNEDSSDEDKIDEDLFVEIFKMMNVLVAFQESAEILLKEADIDIEEIESIVGVPVDKIRKIGNLLENTPSRIVANYIHWNFISNVLKYTNDRMQNGIFQIQKDFIPIEEPTPRWEFCVDDVQMVEIISYEYVKKYFPEEIENVANEMVNVMKSGIKIEIERSNWLNDALKNAATEKVDNMKAHIGYPEWYKNRTEVEQYYKGLSITYQHFDNALMFHKYIVVKNFKQLKTAIEDDMWDAIDPITINAVYGDTVNSLTLPAADFQIPFFSLSHPDVINFGIIGYIISHEVSHGFDPSGRNHDKDGNFIEWDEEINKEYEERANCFAEQYSLYTIKDDNLTINVDGRQTINENIADCTGLEVLHKSYKIWKKEKGRPFKTLPNFENFTEDQLFYLTTAALWCESARPRLYLYQSETDEHSTGRIRVLGGLSNSEHFARAYSCPTGSKMNPEKKCNIWK